MTPQEQELLSELFDRLAKSETNPRDLDAERKIADGLRRAPHAVYALVQTALVQDEALKRANARIEELQAQGGGQEQQRGGSFLDSMRDTVLGRTEPHGSAPSAPSYRPQPQYPPQASSYPPGQSPAPGTGPGFGSGGSFLGTAASTAAGVIGGGLLLNSIRSMFGEHAGLSGHERSALDSASGGGAANNILAQRDRDQDQDQDDDDQAQADKDQDQDQDQDDGDFGGDDNDNA